MNLKDWSQQARGRQAALASALNVTNPNVSGWVAGQKQPGIKTALAIERFTNGEVTRKELRPDDWHEIWPELATPQPTPTAQEGQGA